MCLPAVGAALGTVGTLAAKIPASVLLGTTLAFQAASAVAGFQAQQQQAKAQEAYNEANRQAAIQARDLDLTLIDTRSRQEADAAQHQLFQQRIEAQLVRGRALAQTGNVSGVSVQQLLGDFQAQEGRFADSVRYNTELRLDQLGQERTRTHATAVSRVASLSPAIYPSPFSPLLNFAGPALGTLTTYALLNPNNRAGLQTNGS